MRCSPILLLALGGCGDGLPLEPPITVPAAPVLRFVGLCARPAIWWVRTDPAVGNPIIYLWGATDSAAWKARPDVTGLHWYELDGAGFPLNGGQAATDSVGAGRVESQCVPVW